VITASNRQDERLVIELHEILYDSSFDLGEDPGLAKDGVEAELPIAARRRRPRVG